MSSKKKTDPIGSPDTVQDKKEASSDEDFVDLSKRPIVTDAEITSNMAPRGAEQGRKRALSLSPQQLQSAEETSTRVPEFPLSTTLVQQSKKRLISTHISDFFAKKKRNRK